MAASTKKRLYERRLRQTIHERTIFFDVDIVEREVDPNLQPTSHFTPESDRVNGRSTTVRANIPGLGYPISCCSKPSNAVWEILVRLIYDTRKTMVAQSWNCKPFLTNLYFITFSFLFFSCVFSGLRVAMRFMETVVFSSLQTLALARLSVPNKAIVRTNVTAIETITPVTQLIWFSDGTRLFPPFFLARTRHWLQIHQSLESITNMHHRDIPSKSFDAKETTTDNEIAL